MLARELVQRAQRPTEQNSGQVHAGQCRVGFPQVGGPRCGAAAKRAGVDVGGMVDGRALMWATVHVGIPHSPRPRQTVPTIAVRAWRDPVGEVARSNPRRRRLGARLRTLRERAGLTIEEAAPKLDFSPSKLSRIEN